MMALAPENILSSFHQVEIVTRYNIRSRHTTCQVIIFASRVIPPIQHVEHNEPSHQVRLPDRRNDISAQFPLPVGLCSPVKSKINIEKKHKHCHLHFPSFLIVNFITQAESEQIIVTFFKDIDVTKSHGYNISKCVCVCAAGNNKNKTHYKQNIFRIY